jgi:hypothetical protein
MAASLASSIGPDATALTALRPLSNGKHRLYTVAEAIETADRNTAVRGLVHTGSRLGFLARPGEGVTAYAFLDVLGEDDDLLDTFAITSRKAFRWYYRKLGWRVDHDF